MIAKNELRLGNKILFDSEIDTVTSIYKNGVDGEFKSRWFYDRLHPIPLTTELIDKCGFWANKFDIPSFEINDMATHLELIEANGFYFPSIDQMQDIGPSQNVSLTRIQYLHQLQNLIYVLTGEELTINL